MCRLVLAGNKSSLTELCEIASGLPPLAMTGGVVVVFATCAEAEIHG